MGGMDARWQFSLRHALAATALVALAAWMGHYIVSGAVPFLRFAGLFAVAPLLSAAVGVVARRPAVWRIGAVFDLVAAVVILWCLML
jgi:hypothetical protein